jgi:ADP-ribose pyrophosphatase
MASLSSPIQKIHCLHTKARSTPYLGGPERTPVEDGQISWSHSWPEYTPVKYIAPAVAAAPVWADRPEEISSRLWNEVDRGIDRTSFIGRYNICPESKMPLNPMGRTGMAERGLLGRYGPNHAADPLVTRFCRCADGSVVLDASGAPIVEFVAIKRKDTGEWAIPGGMVNRGEFFSATVMREFGEEAMNTLELPDARREEITKKIKLLFGGAKMIYAGYVDDPRNTDNAWMETAVVHAHDATGECFDAFPLHAGDDAAAVQWMPITPSIQLYASHANFVNIARIWCQTVYAKQHHAKNPTGTPL